VRGRGAVAIKQSQGRFNRAEALPLADFAFIRMSEIAGDGPIVLSLKGKNEGQRGNNYSRIILALAAIALAAFFLYVYYLGYYYLDVAYQYRQALSGNWYGA